MVDSEHVKRIVNSILFITLIIVYYFLYMEAALEQYMKKRTIIVQRRENIPRLDSPVFIICTDPPFKPSFFRDQWGRAGGNAGKYFWSYPSPFHQIFENDSITAMDIYMNMSYQLGSDFEIIASQNKK
jgi:hypothetical protein